MTGGQSTGLQQDRLSPFNQDNEKDLLFGYARDMACAYLEQHRTSDAPASLTKTFLDLARHVSSRYEMETTVPELSCRAGCCYCCFYEVTASPPEVLLVGQHLDTCYSAKERENLKERIDRFLDLTAGRTFEERLQAWNQAPCPLLENGKCHIYPVRPFICRAWNALDHRQCQKAFEEKKPWRHVDRTAHTFYIFGTLRAALQEGCSHMRYQKNTLFLATAIKQYLDHPTPAEAWLGRETLFGV